MIMVQATSLSVTKESYLPTENIEVNFKEMLGHNDDWIGIYPVGSSTEWKNVLRWNWTNDVSEGKLKFEKLPIGEYEIRAFYNNSYKVEATKSFKVQEPSLRTSVVTDKRDYLINESIVATYKDMSGDGEDWIGIYPKGSSNAWQNMVQWAWVGGKNSGTQTFSALPLGSYEVRVFFHNSLISEASYPFVVGENKVVISTNKKHYNPNELVKVTFSRMRGEESDYIGIYPIGAEDDKEEALEWRSVNNQTSGVLSFNGLDAGSYEVRAYFGTSKQRVSTITVDNKAVERKIYMTAEEGIEPAWVHYSGKYEIRHITPGAKGSKGAVRLRAYWENGSNPSGYYYPLTPVLPKGKVLEIDMRARFAPHFNFGVVIETKNGTRRVIWDSYFNHREGRNNPIEPFHSSNGYVLNNPAPIDYHFGVESTKDWIHFKINVEKVLRYLEPDNELINIRLFTATGGEYDNIAVSTH